MQCLACRADNTMLLMDVLRDDTIKEPVIERQIAMHTASRRPLRTPGLLRPAQLSNSYHAANAERTETIACSRGGAGRAPRSEVSKVRDRFGP
jgi:hypothetical protein